MHAVIINQGKQYLVKKDQYIKIDNIDKEVSSNIIFENILYYSDDVNSFLGNPYVANCKVVCIVYNNVVGNKISVIKFKRRKNYLRNFGHKQKYTIVKIVDILFESN